MKNATVIRHIPFEDLGNLSGILTEYGYRITYLEAGLDKLGDLDPHLPDLLIVLGGPIGAYDTDDYPFLTNEIQLLAHRLQADLPTLGICLGAQLMARALGASVYPSTKEIGWSPIQLSEGGKQSPLIHLAAEYTAVLHWHGDTFNLPDGATHLASTQNCQNQAFSWGKNGLALQFHPEVTELGLERWLIGHACEIGTTPNVSVAQLRQDTTRYSQNLEVQATKFWQRWLNQLQTQETSQKATPQVKFS